MQIYEKEIDITESFCYFCGKVCDMNIPDDVILRQTERVAAFFRYWEGFMKRRVEFWQIPGDLDIHTQGHCERVLMHALRIGDARAVTDRQMLALAHAAIFHDTRRRDNYLDTGHGERAAEYYKSFSEHEAAGKSYCQVAADSMVFLPEAYAAIWYHDRDDELGEAYIRDHAGADSAGWGEVYHIFKDADALDRLRLGTWCLDPKFLRTPEARLMQTFAQQLVEATIPPAELERTYRLTEPFRPKQ